MLRYCIAHLLAIATISGQPVQSNRVELALTSYCSTNKIEQIVKFPLVNEFVQTRNRGALLEMCFKVGSPLTITAGFRGFCAIAPEEFYSLALRIAWNENQISDFPILGSFVYSRLTENVDQSVVNNALTHLVESPPRDFASALAGLAMIPEERRESWLLQANYERCLPSNLAAFLEMSLRKPKWRDAMPTRIKKILFAYSEIPGYAQVVFLEFYPESDGHILDVLKRFLSDETTPDDFFESVVDRRRELVSRLLNGHSLAASKRQLKRISTFLETYGAKPATE